MAVDRPDVRAETRQAYPKGEPPIANQIVQSAFSPVRRRSRSWLNDVFSVPPSGELRLALRTRFGRRTALEKDGKWVKPAGSELRRRNTLVEKFNNEAEYTNGWGQKTQEQETSLSEEDLKNLAGGLVLAEYLAIPASVVVSDRNFWARELGARPREGRSPNDAGQPEQIRPALGWLSQALRAAVALSSAAVFCAIVSQLFVLLAHVGEAHF
jgi:hypothetical protein